MVEYKISVNQLASFSRSTDSKKRSIVKQQKNPPAILVGRYGMAKARIRKAISTNGDIQPILSGIEVLKARTPDTDWKKNDRHVSIEAMERFIKMKLPSVLQDHKYEILPKLKTKSFYVNGVEILVSPDLIIKALIDGQYFVGAVKIHVSKNDLFDSAQNRCVTTCIYQYLDLQFDNSLDVFVLPELCICVDVFADTFRNAPENIENTLVEIEVMCEEIKKIWTLV